MRTVILTMLLLALSAKTVQKADNTWKWTKSAPIEAWGGEPVSYTFEITADGGSTWKVIADDIDPKPDDNGFVRYTYTSKHSELYQCRVKAKYPNGKYGVYSDISDVLEVILPKPGTPTHEE